MKKIILSISALLCMLVILNSCTLNNAGTVATQQGNFLIAQVSPDAPALNLAINGGLFDTGLNYKVFTPYIRANPGTYAFSIAKDSDSSGNYFDTATVTIAANKDYSLFYIDSFNKIKAAFINDVFQKPSGDSVYIRFFNFCPNLPQPIDLIDTVGSVAFSQGRTFNDQAFNAQYTLFQEIPKGAYTFNLRTASGTTVKTQTVTLTGGKVYTLIAKGIYGNADSTKALSIGLLEHYPQTNISFTF